MNSVAAWALQRGAYPCATGERERVVVMQMPQVGLDEAQCAAIVSINAILADAYVLMVKTRKAHWDITGPRFRALRARWDEQYQALAEAVDALGERVRALGGEPVASMTGGVTLDALREAVGCVLNAPQSVDALLEDHERIVRALRACDDGRDPDAAALFRKLARQRERDARRLRAFVDDAAHADLRREEPFAAASPA